jgi:hypothetical protein
LLGFCDRTQLEPLWDCVAWHLEQGAVLTEATLEAAARDARELPGGRGRSGTVSPRALAIGIRRVLGRRRAAGGGRETLEEQADRLIREM